VLVVESIYADWELVREEPQRLPGASAERKVREVVGFETVVRKA